MKKYQFDADELMKDELILSKIDVARRQLVMAIKMFFFEEDVVSLHTVACAAHGVIHDIAKHKDIKKSIKDSPLIAKSARSEYLRAVNYPQNFFKHAHSDPKGRMVFRYNGTPLFILDALFLYASIERDLTNEMRIFLIWVQLRFPNLLCLDFVEEELSQIRNTTKNPKTFKTLAKVLLNENLKNRNVNKSSGQKIE